MGCALGKDYQFVYPWTITARISRSRGRVQAGELNIELPVYRNIEKIVTLYFSAIVKHEYATSFEISFDRERVDHVLRDKKERLGLGCRLAASQRPRHTPASSRSFSGPLNRCRVGFSRRPSGWTSFGSFISLSPNRPKYYR